MHDITLITEHYRVSRGTFKVHGHPPYCYQNSYRSEYLVQWYMSPIHCKHEYVHLSVTHTEAKLIRIECSLNVLQFVILNHHDRIASSKQPFPLLSYLSVVVCLRWLYHYMLSVSYIYIYIYIHIYIYIYIPGNLVCVFYFCAVLWHAHIIEYIMTRWSYSFVCTSHYLIIIIVRTYLKVLNI